MQKYVQIHTSKKLFTCYTCKRTFRHQKTVKEHVVVLTGEKPFICPTCNKMFREKEKMQKNMRLHTGNLLFTYLQLVQQVS